MDKDRTLLASGSGSDTGPRERQIGHYKLLSRLGEGGMGVVWLAEQETPRREVALKVIKAGMDTKQVIARFETERQALAVMDHPNIARVIDAGETERARPYFVMEYVKGEAITAYCDRNRLTTRQRLELFIQVCEGVQHAHQKAVIHRDLKPSNILVTVQGDRPVPKIIDFGVAKATSQRLTERTLFTELGQLIGTPEYMSPEQAEMTGTDIDTRTDVYSLGVVLYELLTGVLPFDAKELRSGGLAEIQRRIREEEPSKPSIRVSSLGETSTEVARRRRVDASSLAKRLRGDLDWITLKALAKDRTRRYSSASDFAADIERYLRSEPIRARPPSRLYRLQKLIWRNRVASAASLVVLVTLVGSSVSLGVLASRLAEERDRASSEAAVAREVSSFLKSLFLVSDPQQARGREVSARELLDQGAQRIAELDAQPQVQFTMMMTIGQVYESLGHYEEAKEFLEKSLRRAPSSGERIDALRHLGSLFTSTGDYEEAAGHLRSAREEAERHYGSGSDELSSILLREATLLSDLGRYQEAEAILRRLVRDDEARGGEVTSRRVSIHMELATLLNELVRFEDAEKEFERALSLEAERGGTDSPRLTLILNNLGNLKKDQGQLDEAASYYRRALEQQEKVFGPNHPDVGRSTGNLGNVLLEQGDLDGAEALYERTLSIMESGLGPDHPDLAKVYGQLGVLNWQRGDVEVGINTLIKGGEILEASLGSDNLEVALFKSILGELYRLSGQAEKAVQPYREALEVRSRQLPHDSERVKETVEGLVSALRELGRQQEADEFEERFAIGSHPR